MNFDKELEEFIEKYADKYLEDCKDFRPNTKAEGDDNPEGNPNGKPIIRVSIATLDPNLAKFLPEDIQQLIARDMQNTNGSPGFVEKEQKEEVSQPRQKINYNFKMVNCNQDLKTLVQKLKNSKVKKWNMLLYGESGSGKSEFAKYLAQELKMPLIKKKCSSIVEKWVGQTERNLAEVFKEARDKKAILLFDEADSFLFTRINMEKDFSIQAVNEMLVQMEEHTLPVILTTNLRNKLDAAMNRRVLFKIEYKFMTPANVAEGIKEYFGKEYKLTKEQLKELKYLTAGDFRVVKDKAAVLDDGKYTNKLIYEYLLHEQKEKNVDEGSHSITV